MRQIEPVRRGLGSAVLLDRDGVLNDKIADGYVLSLSDLVVRDDGLHAAAMLTKAGLPLIIVTNQSCVGRGYLTIVELDRIMDELLARLRRAGAEIAGWYCCPHDPAAGCACRKPGTRLLEIAAQEHGIDLARSFVIGDSVGDIEAAMHVGATGLLIDSSAKTGALQAARTIIEEMHVGAR
ncbi:MAG: D-glycero-alpha-D-manno-heptose-1,7-bisphosphate 7-phosphatase [Vulcanimicrobiaceae bacterium]